MIFFFCDFRKCSKIVKNSLLLKRALILYGLGLSSFSSMWKIKCSGKDEIWIKEIFFQSLSPLSFSQEVPKDYRHVSLTGVKQRFEDEVFHQISKEKVHTVFTVFILNCNKTTVFLELIHVGLQKVMDYKELCQILAIPEEPQMDPPSPTGHPSDIHAFLASPSSTNKR